MPRTALTMHTAARFGGGIVDIAAAAPDSGNGNTMINTGVEKLIVSNASGGDLTVTVAVPSNYRSLDGSVTTKTYTIATAKTAILGPWPPDIFNQTTGVINIDWSTATSVTVSAVSHTA